MNKNVFFANSDFFKLGLRTFLLFSFLLLIFSMILKDCFFYVDDYYACEMENIVFKDILKMPIKNNYVSSFFDRLFGYYLPHTLNLHPTDFKVMFYPFIVSFFVFFFISVQNAYLYCSYYGNEKNKYDNELFSINKNCYVFSYISLFLFLLFLLIEQPIMLFCYDGFFRMLLPVFLFINTVYYFIKFIKIPAKFTKKDMFILSISAFFSCISNEMICFISIFSLGLYFVLNMKINKNVCEGGVIASGIIKEF